MKTDDIIKSKATIFLLLCLVSVTISLTLLILDQRASGVEMLIIGSLMLGISGWFAIFDVVEKIKSIQPEVNKQ